MERKVLKGLLAVAVAALLGTAVAHFTATWAMALNRTQGNASWWKEYVATYQVPLEFSGTSHYLTADNATITTHTIDASTTDTTLMTTGIIVSVQHANAYMNFWGRDASATDSLILEKDKFYEFHRYTLTTPISYLSAHASNSTSITVVEIRERYRKRP